MLKLVDARYEPPRCYLRRCYGGWGPDILPDTIDIAMKFPTKREAIMWAVYSTPQQYKDTQGNAAVLRPGGFKVIPVEIAITYKEVV